MPDVVLGSPLAEVQSHGKCVLQVDGRVCALGEIAFVEMFNLRGDAADAGFSQAMQQHTGLQLPLHANTASIGTQRQLLWLGPDEWLLKLRDGAGDAVATTLRTALQGIHSAVVDVGHGNTTFMLEGPAAADLLARGCPLDLHPRVFPVGAVAQTHVAKAGATVLCLVPGIHFELTVRRSFADYLFRWLCAAGE